MGSLTTRRRQPALHRLIAPMEPSERMGKLQRHRQDARPEHEHVQGVVKIKAAHPADEQVGNSKVEKSP